MLHINASQAKLSNLNPRIEKVGKDKTRPAADLKFTVNVHNSVLNLISAGLLHSLYKNPDEQGHQADLVAGGDAITTLRHPKAKAWASTEDWPGYFINIKCGDFDLQEIELDKVTLKGITADAKEGGTVELSFTVSGYPTGADVGVLYELQGHEVELTLSPPSLGDLAKLREEAKKSAASNGGDGDAGGGGGGGEDDDDAPPMGNEAAGRAFPDAIDARGDTPPSARRGKGKAAAGPAVH